MLVAHDGAQSFTVLQLLQVGELVKRATAGEGVALGDGGTVLLSILDRKSVV